VPRIARRGLERWRPFVRLGRQEDAKYVINVKQIAKFVVGLGDKVSPTDIEEGMRVG
jgi:ATP-dependent 26S proteasome regulatory subunit